MRIEVDQSGKIENTSTDTILAYSNDRQYTILIPSIVKREIVRKYRAQKKVNKMFFLKLFSVCVFLLIKNVVKKLDKVVIDIEFESRDNDIKYILLGRVQRIEPSFDKRKIIFQRIGKKSKAHEVALKVFRNQIIENRVIKTKEIEEFM